MQDELKTPVSIHSRKNTRKAGYVCAQRHTSRLKDLVCSIFLPFSESGLARSRACGIQRGRRHFCRSKVIKMFVHRGKQPLELLGIVITLLYITTTDLTLELTPTLTIQGYYKSKISTS